MESREKLFVFRSCIATLILIPFNGCKRSKDGMMQWPEFCELLQCLTFWHTTFSQYDQDRSGYIEAVELGRVIRERYGSVFLFNFLFSSKHHFVCVQIAVQCGLKQNFLICVFQDTCYLHKPWRQYWSATPGPWMTGARWLRLTISCQWASDSEPTLVSFKRCAAFSKKKQKQKQTKKKKFVAVDDWEQQN